MCKERQHLEKRLERHAPESTKRSKHAQGCREVLLEVMLGPLQFAVCRHLIKCIEMGFNQSRQFICFVSSEYVLQHFANNGCVRLQADPTLVRAPFVSEEGLNQGTRMADKVKGLRGVHFEVLLVDLFAFALLIDLRNVFATR